MKKKYLKLLFLLTFYQGTSIPSITIGEHRKDTEKTPWVNVTPSKKLIEETQTETTTKTTNKQNLLEKGITTVKNIKDVFSSTKPAPYDTTSTTTAYDYDPTGLTGAGSWSVQTGDIKIKDVYGIKTEVITCGNDIVSGCGSGSCNITIGPCSVTPLNAAPIELSLSRYLSSHKPFITTIHEVMESNVPESIKLKLTKDNDYTMIIHYKSGGIRDISYMIVAFPTETERVNKIKNLPLGLASYLKKQNGTIIKIYKSVAGSSIWTEISEQRVGISLSDKIATQANIGNIEISGLGSLIVVYRNLKNSAGMIIPTTRVRYSHFIK